MTSIVDPKAMGKVAVLYGGQSAEREVSLMSGNGVLKALTESGVDAIGFDPAEQELNQLKVLGIERAFIAMHGRGGEDGSLQGALELLGIPYTGSGVAASAIAMDKVMTKRLWAQDGLPTPAFVTLDARASTDEELLGAAQRLGLPLIFKAPHEGSTLGLAKVSQAQELRQCFAIAAALDEKVLAEEFIQGRELTVTVLDSGKNAKALPITEIIAPGGNYDFQNKYFTDVTRYVCPAELPEASAQEIADIAVQAYRSIGCEGWGRVDVILRDSDQRPFLLEVNTSPGMTSHSLVPIAARAVGMEYRELCLHVLASARLKMGLKG